MAKPILRCAWPKAVADFAGVRVAGYSAGEAGVFKRGICSLEDLRYGRTISRNTPISYSLLRFASVGTAETIGIFETIVRHMELSSGTHRTSYRGRLGDVDMLVAPHLARRFGVERHFEVHDWAASDALVSSEWAQHIFGMLPSCQFTASDLTLYLIEAYQENRDVYIFEPNGTPIQYVRSPFVVQFNRRDSPIFLVNRLVSWWARRNVKILQSLVSQCHWSSIDDLTEFCGSAAVIRLLPLVHPEARALQRLRQNFVIARHCALSPLKVPVQVIRTMNIYNRGYFKDADLVRGFRAVYDSLVDGGIWILGRTVEERRPVRNLVSIFTKSDHGFRLLDSLNGGSDLEESLKSWGFLDKIR